jgi:chromosome partition protein MukF
MPSDPSRLIAALARDRINLDLKTLDLCFLAGLYLRADRASLASFEEDVLIDMFEQVCDVVDPGAECPRKRATHAIQRLRDQRMLARVDGAGIVRSGEYTLTRLAAAVVEYFLADEALTRESLTLLTGTLRAQLAEILAAAKRADTGGFDEAVAGLAAVPAVGVALHGTIDTMANMGECGLFGVLKLFLGPPRIA